MNYFWQTFCYTVGPEPSFSLPLFTELPRETVRKGVRTTLRPRIWRVYGGRKRTIKYGFGGPWGYAVGASEAFRTVSEDEFSEVGIAPVQHLPGTRTQIGFLRVLSLL